MKTLRYNAIYSTLGMAIRLGIALATGPLLIRMLGLELYGIWVVLLSVVSVILIAQLGLDTALTQLLAAAYAQHDVDDMGHIVGTSLVLISVSGAAVTIIFSLSASFFLPKLFPAYAGDASLLTTVRLFALALLPRFWQQWAMASEAGLLRYDWQARIEGAGYFLLSVGVVSLAWAGQSLQVLAVWYMVATIATLLSHLLFLKQAWQRLSLKPTYSPVSVGQLYRFGLSQWISNIGGLLFSQADRILVNVLLGPGPVGLYAVATSVAVRINEFSAVPIQSIAPMISTIAASGQSSRLVHVFKRALRLNALIVYLVSIAVMLWAKPIAILLASPEHSQTIVSLFQILVPIYAVYSLNAPGYFAAIGLQRPRINAVYVLPSGILTLLLMVWLIPSFHLVGVVLGNSGYILTLAINLKVARDIGLGVKGYIEEIIPFIGSLLIGCGLSWANVILADPSYLTTALFFVLSATLALWIDNQSVVDTFQLIVGQTQRWLAVIRRV